MTNAIQEEKENSDIWIRTKEACEISGFTTSTLVRWSKENKIRVLQAPSRQRRYHKHDIYKIAGLDISEDIQNEKHRKNNICYCRVSTERQNDLTRQENFFREKYPNHTIISDIGSGINWKRKGLLTILERAMQGDIKEVVVTNRDRLCRFAFELIEFILRKNNVKLIVLDNQENTSESESDSRELLSIIHRLSDGYVSKRRYKNRKNKNLSEQETISDNEKMDGD